MKWKSTRVRLRRTGPGLERIEQDNWAASWRLRLLYPTCQQDPIYLQCVPRSRPGRRGSPSVLVRMDRPIGYDWMTKARYLSAHTQPPGHSPILARLIYFQEFTPKCLSPVSHTKLSLTSSICATLGILFHGPRPAVCRATFSYLPCFNIMQQKSSALFWAAENNIPIPITKIL